MAVVVHFLDEAQIDKRQVEIAWSRCGARSDGCGNAAVEGTQKDGILLPSGTPAKREVSIFRNVAHRDPAHAVSQHHVVHRNPVISVGILHADLCIELRRERQQIHCVGDRCVDVVRLAVHGQTQLRDARSVVGYRPHIVIHTARRQQDGCRRHHCGEDSFLVTHNCPLFRRHICLQRYEKLARLPRNNGIIFSLFLVCTIYCGVMSVKCHECH